MANSFDKDQLAITFYQLSSNVVIMSTSLNARGRDNS